MSKATSRKHGSRRKARAHHAAKPHSHRPSAGRSSTPRVSRPPVIVPDPEIVGEEFTYRSEVRSVDEDLEDELGIYGPNRGETAG